MVTIILSGGLTFYFLNLRDELLFGISAAILFVAVLTLLKRLLFYIPTRYTFDLSANRVYQSNLLFKNREIMTLDEVVIFQSSEMGGRCYKMGRKRKQFVKNHTISQDFDDKKNPEDLMVFETEILDKIMLLINRHQT